MESNELRYFCVTFTLLFKYELGLIVFNIKSSINSKYKSMDPLYWGKFDIFFTVFIHLKKLTTLTKILGKTTIGIHLLSEKSTAICLCTSHLCAHDVHRNALSQHVSTALRCLGLKWLKITLVFKLTRLKTCENEKLSWGSSTGLIVKMGSVTDGGLKPT